MVVDLSHASFRTAMDAIEFSQAPVPFSHDGSYTLGQEQGGGEYAAGRLRRDEELVACAQKGGIVGVTVQPSVIRSWGISELSIERLLDHYDYMVNLLGIDHVAIGTDSSIGVRSSGFIVGVESPAEGKNIIRGLIPRGYSDADIIKITDFGISRVVADSTLRQTGKRSGTVPYMSPEQFRGEVSTPSSDIYSLGCTWYEMLTGSPPFPDGSLADKINAHATQPPPNPRRLNPDVPEALVAVLPVVASCVGGAALGRLFRFLRGRG